MEASTERRLRFSIFLLVSNDLKALGSGRMLTSTSACLVLAVKVCS